MTKWTRTPTDRLCGGCAGTIRKGHPLLVIELPRLSHTKVRGECCAGAAPPDLPSLVEQAALVPQTMTRFCPDMLPLDFKMAAAGREPGEEG